MFEGEWLYLCLEIDNDYLQTCPDIIMYGIFPNTIQPRSPISTPIIDELYLQRVDNVTPIYNL